jgi:hypothetical protein
VGNISYKFAIGNHQKKFKKQINIKWNVRIKMVIQLSVFCKEMYFFNKYDWLTELRNNIENIVGVQNIYMCKKNEYDVYK